MTKGVDKVRKSIEQRRKMRHITRNQNQKTHVYPPFPMDEEKHGYPPNLTYDAGQGKQRKNQQWTHIVIKGILACSLFVGTAIVMNSNTDILSKPKKWTRHAMTEEFPFARMHKWYQDSFGSPMALSPKKNGSNEHEALAMPVNGTVTESFKTNGSGIKITTAEKTNVTALQDGIVLFAGKDSQTGKTVMIQHPDGSKSTYGYLDALNVHVYEFITTGQEIGTFKPTTSNETIYFAIQKDDKYIDPIQVIQVDESS